MSRSDAVASDRAATVLDLHGLLTIGLVDADRSDVKVIARQLGPLPQIDASRRGQRHNDPVRRPPRCSRHPPTARSGGRLRRRRVPRPARPPEDDRPGQDPGRRDRHHAPRDRRRARPVSRPVPPADPHADAPLEGDRADPRERVRRQRPGDARDRLGEGRQVRSPARVRRPRRDLRRRRVGLCDR